MSKYYAQPYMSVDEMRSCLKKMGGFNEDNARILAELNDVKTSVICIALGYEPSEKIVEREIRLDCLECELALRLYQVKWSDEAIAHELRCDEELVINWRNNRNLPKIEPIINLHK